MSFTPIIPGQHNKDEARKIVGGKTGANLFAKSNGVTAKGEGFGFQVNLNDVIQCHARVKQMLLEEFEKQETLAASTYANKDFNQIVAFRFNKPIQKKFASNYHGRSLFLTLL